MQIALLVICLILSLAASIWALVIIFKRSVVGGLLSLFLGLPVLYYLVTGWGKEGQDIKAPFFLSLVAYGIAIAIGVSMGASAAKEMMEMQQQMQAPAARSSPSFRDPAPAAANIRVRNNEPTPQPAAPPMYRTETPKPVQQAPRRPKAAQSDCVYKPVMTDEDLAKCK